MRQTRSSSLLQIEFQNEPTLRITLTTLPSRSNRRKEDSWKAETTMSGSARSLCSETKTGSEMSWHLTPPPGHASEPAQGLHRQPWKDIWDDVMRQPDGSVTLNLGREESVPHRSVHFVGRACRRLARKAQVVRLGPQVLVLAIFSPTKSG
jgi:hypothetical protein